MNRWWTLVPLAVTAAVPIWTAPSAPIVWIEAAAALLCTLGTACAVLGPVTVGCILAAIGYALALWSVDVRVDVVGSAVFGLALLLVLDLSEFARRFRGAEIASDVVRAQLAYWLGRAALVAGIVLVLTLAGLAGASLIPAGGRAVVAGIGAVLVLAGTLYGASALIREGRGRVGS